MDEFETEQDEFIDPKRLVNTVRKKRKLRKGRKRQSIFRKFFRFIMTIVLLCGFVYISKMPQWYLPKDSFKKVAGTSVEIINNSIVKPQMIFALLKNTEVPNVPIYMAKTEHIRKEIKKLPPVKEVYIRRYAFPARLQIILKERVPVITISPDLKVQPVAAFSEDGVIMKKEFLPLDKNIKTILVLSYGNKGDDYTKWNAAKIHQIEEMVNYIETYSKEKVEYVDMRNPFDVYVKIKTVNIRLGRLDESLYKRIERLPSILPQVKLVDSKVKYLDLRWEKVFYLKLQ
ncbi:MAG: FtsQ-type POTRA domain-containing protein [Brachyspira sp.]|nr:FtsQ-type POTRA domain-containing protein [Brachyspira sp.]